MRTVKSTVTSKQLARDLRKTQTDAERLLWASLRDRQLQGIKFRRQVPLGTYVVDFLSKKHDLVVELDGSQHQTSGRIVVHDDARTRWLTSKGYQVTSFWNHEIFEDLDAVLTAILLAAGEIEG